MSRVIPVDPFDLVMFGGTGDLARRKILPGLFRRFCSGQMPEGSQIIGAARSDMTDADYRGMVSDAIAEFGGGRQCETGTLDAFLDAVSYVKTHAKGDGG